MRLFTPAENVLASSFPLLRIYQLSIMKTTIASHSRTSQGDPRRLGLCLRLSESITSQYCTAAAPGLAGKIPLWQLKTFWAESGTYLVQEGVPQLVSNQKKVSGYLWVGVILSNFSAWLEPGNWQLHTQF